MRFFVVPPTWRRLRSPSWRLSHVCCTRCLNTASRPSLFRMLEDGSEQAIEEDDLFSYNRHRWLRNDREERDMRYVKFNLEVLVSKALRKKKTKPEGKECVKITKLLEGDRNKTLLLTMNDGERVIARLPNPIAGPSYFTVASEVATRKFISLAGAPVPMPHIWDWDFRQKNDVGAEWILEDVAAGLPLRQFWFSMDRESQLKIVKQVVEIEEKLGAIKFPLHGSLYLKRWLAGRDKPFSPLSNLSGLTKSPDEDGACNTNRDTYFRNFAIGPSVDRSIYHRLLLMKAHHGPFHSLFHYARCLGRNERRFVKKMGWDRPNYFQSAKSTEDPQTIDKLTVRFLAACPYIGEYAPEDPSTISHPDLSLDNIFIDPNNKKIACLTGWQGTVVSPPILKRPYPSFLDSQFETRSTNVNEKRPRDLYRELTSEADPLRYERIYKDPKSYNIHIAPLSAIRRTYETQSTFELRESLNNFIDYYDRTYPEKRFPPDLCPTAEEHRKHERERLARSELQMTFHMVQDAHRLSSEQCPDIPLDGRVRSEDFETAQRWGRDYRDHYMDLAGTSQSRLALHTKLWPLNDLGEATESRPLIRRLPTNNGKRSSNEQP